MVDSVRRGHLCTGGPVRPQRLDQDRGEAEGGVLSGSANGQAVPRALVQPPEPRSQQEALGGRGGAETVPTAQTARQPLEGYLASLRRKVPLPPLRTDNDIKNHFYSTLRRSLRRLNKISGEKNSTSQMREIKPSVLSTIMNYIYEQQHALEGDFFRSLQGTNPLTQTYPPSSSNSPTSNPSRPTSNTPPWMTHAIASQRYSA